MRFWKKRLFLSYMLWPFSIIYKFIITVRTKLYLKISKKTTYFLHPVIVVGNITIGGTGKTPFVIWLYQWLKSQGLKPGIVSRGYKGEAKKWPQILSSKTTPKLVGDEPILIARKTGAPMVVGPDRVAAVKKLLIEYKCDIVISDDGLQHYALGRNIEIAMIDGNSLFGNGFLLPAGPLREPTSRLELVDFILINQQTLSAPIPTHRDISTKKSFNITPVPGKIYQNTCPENKLEITKIDKPVHAVTGIANPERFFQTLRLLGIKVTRQHPYPDHHTFKLEDIDFEPNTIIIMTEKDAVKCGAFVDARHWTLPISLKVDNQFKIALKRKIDTII